MIARRNSLGSVIGVLARIMGTAAIVRCWLFLVALAAAASLSAQTPFLPGIVNTPDSGEAFGTLTPDGREFYFTRHKDFARHHIMVTRLESGRWSVAVPLPFSGKYNDREPKLSPDGHRLYFSSNRPFAPGDTVRRRDLDLWFVDRTPAGAWGTPRRVEGVNSDGHDFCPVVTADGTLYFITRRGESYNQPASGCSSPVIARGTATSIASRRPSSLAARSCPRGQKADRFFLLPTKVTASAKPKRP